MNHEKMVELRKAANLTQNQLAEKVMCARGVIARIEVGAKEPSLNLLRAIAEALGTEARELV